ncbi:uncharacterized protein LOC119549226 [Drosophila subpulchrella]|uniref:uncharacterized protein LOC119549226 n=1 Tax=Drosophila subpulchrella TaxID=1486046 RepID=UPI0018A15C01|nr:uncharacterized protein LOC119549226 [Drosophila subpulchrella]
MMSRTALLIAGLLLIVGRSAVSSYPQSALEEDGMQGDDNFDYEEDNDSAPSPQIKASSSTGETINKTLTVTGIRGEDVVLKCDVGSNLQSSDDVVLWHFGNNVISNGKNLVHPNFELNANYDLTILKANPQDAGTYYCKVLPSGSLVYTKVIIAEHSLDAIAPESSTSAAGSGSSFLGYTLMGSTILLLLGMGKH